MSNKTETIEKNQSTKKPSSPTIEKVLAFIGVTRETVRKDAYDHWKRFVQLVNLRSGRSWHNDIRPKMRSWLGIDYRYIDAYLDACLSWGIMEIKNEKLFYKGIPSYENFVPKAVDNEAEQPISDQQYRIQKFGSSVPTLEEWKAQREQKDSKKQGGK